MTQSSHATSVSLLTVQLQILHIVKALGCCANHKAVTASVLGHRHCSVEVRLRSCTHYRRLRSSDDRDGIHNNLERTVSLSMGKEKSNCATLGPWTENVEEPRVNTSATRAHADSTKSGGQPCERIGHDWGSDSVAANAASSEQTAALCYVEVVWRT